MKDNNTTTVEKKAEPILQMQADMLTLIDIVTQFSRRVELIDRDALYEAFCEKAAKAAVPTAQELVDETQAKFDNDGAARSFLASRTHCHFVVRARDRSACRCRSSGKNQGRGKG